MTDDGYLDLKRVPIDSVLRQSVSADEREFESACRTLGIMYQHGRTEAGVYLIGLFHHWRTDTRRLASIVPQMPHGEQTAELLVGELYRVKSNNTTRRYLNAVIDTLRSYPRELVEKHFERLSSDTKAFSHRMRAKFKDIIVELHFGREDWWG